MVQMKNKIGMLLMGRISRLDNVGRDYPATGSFTGC
jgi:hypothetical protein